LREKKILIYKKEEAHKGQSYAELSPRGITVHIRITENHIMLQLVPVHKCRISGYWILRFLSSNEGKFT